MQSKYVLNKKKNNENKKYPDKSYWLRGLAGLATLETNSVVS